MTHFIKAEGSQINILKVILNIVLFIPTLGAPMWLFYEYWAVEHYWKNKWRLNRLLNKGLVTAAYVDDTSIFSNHIKKYTVNIEGVSYMVWIWDNESMTLDDIDYKNNDYIGLFSGSLITKWLTKKTIRRIKFLSEQ